AFGTNNVVLTCADGGPCKVGDTGPGGGIVFYVAPDLIVANGMQWRYIEAYTSFKGTVTLCRYQNKNRVETYGSFGDGYENTQTLVKHCGGSQTLGYVIGNMNDWYIPGFDELQYAAKYLKLNGKYWSSQVMDWKAVNAFVLSKGKKYYAPVSESYGLVPFRRFGS
ncbi:MAG: hypothetical protein ACKOBK_01895, partial [Acidimicrobiaceae bacterium]